MFNALVLQQQQDIVHAQVQELDESQLPAGDVLVQIHYSSFNYKDGMILKGLGKLVRNYPHVPGIDFAGCVEQSSNPAYQAGDKVLVTGWRVGETHWGGFAQKARVSADWCLPLPTGLDCRQAMMLGTPGLTAMLALMAMEREGLAPGEGKVLITGASGNVGSLAVALLANLGYQVEASTGKLSASAMLQTLGAKKITARLTSKPENQPALGPKRWIAAMDTVGGPALAHILSHLELQGMVAAIGLTGGNQFCTSLLPFLLRGVKMLGIESATCPIKTRKIAWERLAHEMPLQKLEAITQVHSLEELPRLAEAILAGELMGRCLIDVN